MVGGFRFDVAPAPYMTDFVFWRVIKFERCCMQTARIAVAAFSFFMGLTYVERYRMIR